MMFRSVGSKLLTRSFKRNGFVRFLSANQRPPSNDFSLDLNFVASHPDLVKAHLNARHSSEDIISQVDKISELRQQRKELIVKGDRARNKRKTLSKEIGALMSQGKKDAVDYLKQEVELATREAQTAEQEQVGIEAEIEEVLLHLPNLVDDRVPYGFDDSENKIVSIWGEDKRKIGEEFKWHDEIAKDLGGLDMEAASKLSGSRFSVLIGDIAKLERALTQYFVDFHTSRGYTEVSVPFIVSHSTLRGTGQLPKFEDDLFKVNHSVGGEDAFLIPTSEVPVTNLFRDTILQADQLPISLVALSPCFRAEAGSGGKDSRGLLRQHQFLKVELVKICRPEDSRQEHERLTNDAEDLLKSLELPYRKVLLCSGDLGFAARICYDLEVWLPGQNNYREISSCSNCYDFQARRMKLRFKASQKQNEFCHTLNGSGVAVGRALVAILENYQEADGSVVIPEVLRPYMGGLTKLVPKKDKSNFPYKK